MKRVAGLKVSTLSSKHSLSASASTSTSAGIVNGGGHQLRRYAASSPPSNSRHHASTSNKGKERISPTFDNASTRSHTKLTPYPPPGLRLLSSTTESTRLGIDSEADLGRHFYLNKVLEQWAAKPATRMTLRQLIFFGRTLGRDREKILKSANYVRQELPVRIAHRIRDLQALPFVVMTNQHLEDVYQKYWSAFETFRRFPHIKTMDDNERFCTLLRTLLDDHLTIIPSLTIGIVESSHHLQPQQLDKFMERMLRSRISRRVLAEQHIALSEALDDPFHFFNEPAVRYHQDADADRQDLNLSDNNAVGDHVGIIYTRLSVASVVNKGIKLLTKMFANVQGIISERIPRVEVDGDLKARFAYIPEHLEYIVFELLKNAIRATIRKNAGEENPGLVRVTIVEGPPEEDLIIRISDQGGGLPDLIAQLSAPSLPAYVPKPAVGGFATPPVQGGKEQQDSAASASANVGGVGGDQIYPIPFPDTGHVGGYPPRGSRERLSNDETTPVTLMDEHLPGSMRADATSFYAEPWAQASLPSTRIWAARGGVGSAGGVGGSTTPNEFGTVGTSTTANIGVEGGYIDPLIDALCSFSNVRKRLEIESAQNQANGGSHASNLYGLPTTSKQTQNASGAADLISAGLGTRDRFDALKTIGKFKGTVTEQVVANTSKLTNNNNASTNSKPSAISNNNDSSSSTSSDKGGSTAKVIHQAMEGTGPAALHTVQVETGLGLPMAKVYCDFFGGSLSFRSLDGHSTDIYVRLPKLGTRLEAIEEIVL
ncbi:related to branched chain alpha-ketoacid dehydrogenase kinase [Melanopsichium pennsylvanicum]|uniref:Protein-serine/threonine kinase n=2 Tax=Melanopsichium pennsylvanicum TaxID=63383 RepID=A0AAJ4XJI9_9BASI|nr:related to branched chain alpha-ketoacid dehydrogenase kinase [Melanopsichium pennsylvanicum 4]SNX83172.1 related to branched chain alpha-ketoacid dehydrogenase kinase [Melanopsichium pennsylvanicum]